jgi:hypothetical protein
MLEREKEEVKEKLEREKNKDMFDKIKDGKIYSN